MIRVSLRTNHTVQLISHRTNHSVSYHAAPYLPYVSHCTCRAVSRRTNHTVSHLIASFLPYFIAHCSSLGIAPRLPYRITYIVLAELHRALLTYPTVLPPYRVASTQSILTAPHRIAPYQTLLLRTVNTEPHCALTHCSCLPYRTVPPTQNPNVPRQPYRFLPYLPRILHRTVP